MCVLPCHRGKGIESMCICMYSLMCVSESKSEYGVEFLLKIQGSLVERREIRLVR